MVRRNEQTRCSLGPSIEQQNKAYDRLMARAAKIKKPDPRDAELETLRKRVVELEAWLRKVFDGVHSFDGLEPMVERSPAGALAAVRKEAGEFIGRAVCGARVLSGGRGGV